MGLHVVLLSFAYEVISSEHLTTPHLSHHGLLLKSIHLKTYQQTGDSQGMLNVVVHQPTVTYALTAHTCKYEVKQKNTEVRRCAFVCKCGSLHCHINL